MKTPERVSHHSRDKLFIEAELIQSFFKKRKKNSHKGEYGHALIAAGSLGKIGAAVLSVKAALRSGAGLVTSLLPACGYDIMQSTNPEAMVLTCGDSHLFNVPELNGFTAIAIGPGLDVTSSTISFLYDLLKKQKGPLGLDADALNIIAGNNKYPALIPEGSVLTPHPGEFRRLVGEWKDDGEKLQKQLAFSKKYEVVVVLKGANTSVSTPDGEIYFNTTGNPGMAKGGSGDVLTGIIVSLLAQKYSSVQSAILGVYIHGLAGDLAKKNLGETSMKAGDIIYYLPQAFKTVE